MGRLELILGYPTRIGASGSMFDPKAITQVAQAAEAAGWHGIAFTEHPAPGAKWLAGGGHESLDPFVALGAAAAVTQRLRLLTYLSVAAYRHPLVLAKAAATVDLISQGRMVLGLGLGYQRAEFHALGLDLRRRVAHLERALATLPLHWSGEPFTMPPFDGPEGSVGDGPGEGGGPAVVGRPRPVQDPIPIWLGGNGPRTRFLAARACQGWMPMFSGPEMARTTGSVHLGRPEDLVPLLAELREQRGDAPLDVVVNHLDRTIGHPDDAVEVHRDALGRLEAAGATHVVVSLDGATVEELTDQLDHVAQAHIAPGRHS